MNFRIESAGPSMGDPSRVLFLLPSEGEATAEDLAMLQALYSRDPRPIDSSIKLAKTTKSGEFLNRFYVGYGHDSIADCGMVLIAIENVPMLVAKFIQHYQLYKGQESSTRYLDWSSQPFVSRTAAGRVFQNNLRDFYTQAMEPQIRYMAEYHGLDLKSETGKRAANSAAFDVLRGFLPIGALTNLSWYVDLRNLNEHTLRLLEVANELQVPELEAAIIKIRTLAIQVFPNTFQDETARRRTFSESEWTYGSAGDKSGAHFALRALSTRTIHPSVEWGGLIDFASWRDLARHRSVWQAFPAITRAYGFENWYIQLLHPDLRGAAGVIATSANAMGDVMALPMGIRVPFFTQGLQPKYEYIARLRTGTTIHPTLRAHAIQLGAELARHGSSVRYNSDPSWSVGDKRAAQDIKRVGV